MTSSKIVDSPVGWVQDHIRAYVESNGQEGHMWRGVPTLLLTTTGRKSGELRRTALIYGRDSDDYVIVASKGGAPNNPLWYENLVAQPKVTIQVGADVFDCVASTYEESGVAGGHRQKVWDSLVAIWPGFAEYQTKTARRIPLVRLKRVS
ncbi:MAG: nitroreductase family deazaflavin-dependent oxidoreductase [Acidimicrobiaceae bacterium]